MNNEPYPSDFPMGACYPLVDVLCDVAAQTRRSMRVIDLLHSTWTKIEPDSVDHMSLYEMSEGLSLVITYAEEIMQRVADRKAERYKTEKYLRGAFSGDDQ